MYACYTYIVKALRPVPPIRITPIMFIISVQNQSKMKPRAVPERSPRHFPRKAAKSFQKSTKRLQKSTKRLPKMTPKTSRKSQKTVWVAFFSHRKNYDFLEAVFSCFLSPPGGPRPSKSSQNAIKVCKNRGLPFLLKSMFFYKNVPKMTPFGTPRGS